MKRLASVAFVFAALLATGCASTTFESTWKEPGAGPADITGKKIVAIALAPTASKLAAEDAMVERLKAEGADAIQSYLILDKNASKDEAKAKLEREGIEAAVVVKVVGTDKEVRSTGGSMYMGMGYPYRGGFYGGGWGWGVYSTPDIRTDTLVSLETLVYSVTHDKLVWAARSKTTNPSNIAKFAGEVMDGAIKEMKNTGLLVTK